MILLDTNTYIYISNGTTNPSVLAKHDIGYASITRIEALGFHELVAQEERRLKTIFEKADEFHLSISISGKAVELRQAKKMSLGDSIVAATALENDLELWTANTADFEHIEGLRLHNPTKGQV